jgi:hypothetical protein
VRVPVNGLRLYGVALVAHENGRATPTLQTTVLRFRELGALVRPAPYARVECTAAELAAHRRVIDSAFRTGAILPAPCGTVFRSAERVRRWMVQNYIALSEGIHFVAGRCEARVHISARNTTPGEPFPDIAPVAAECLRELRRSAVASVPVRREESGITASAAFLVEQERWSEFVEQVSEQAARYDELTFEQTGPWPPYDFVRMDFGA